MHWYRTGSWCRNGLWNGVLTGMYRYKAGLRAGSEQASHWNVPYRYGAGLVAGMAYGTGYNTRAIEGTAQYFTENTGIRCRTRPQNVQDKPDPIPGPSSFAASHFFSAT